MTVEGQLESGAADKARSISQIIVEGLFGRYNYSIPVKIGPVLNPLILYGENGTGKTTILNLVYHILSPGRVEGHRTYVAQQPFRKLEVLLANGVRVTAEKKGEKLEGDFLWSVSDNNTSAEVFLEANERGAISGKLPDAVEAQYSKVLQLLTDLDLQLFFLPDDRKTLLDSLGSQQMDDELSGDLAPETERLLIRRLVRQGGQPEGIPLKDAVKNLVDWIKTQAQKGSSVGETNASAIYTKIIKSLVEAGKQTDRVGPSTVRSLSRLFKLLAERNRELTDIGVLPDLNLDEIAAIVMSALDGPAGAAVLPVTRAYVDGMMAKFTALQETKDRINTFLRNVNQLYFDKSVSFNLQDGLRITTPKGQQLSLDMLSSGEKQLLLLLCQIIVASGKASIVIIDEPELSLNVTWQRRLVGALLECAQGSNFQLILATHSIELLTQYSRNVVRLPVNASQDSPERR